MTKEQDENLDPLNQDQELSRGSIDETVDPDATLIEETIEVPQSHEVSGPQNVPPGDDSDATVLEETLDVVPTHPGLLTTELEETILQGETKISPLDATLESTSDGSPTGDGDTVLSNTDLGLTINPQQLSSSEQEMWSEMSAEFVSPELDRNRIERGTIPEEPIDRTVVDTTLQLRNRHVATPMQDDSESADYRLVRLLGKGGMGNVFVARQASLDRVLAVKVIRPLDDKKRARLAEQGKLDIVEKGRRQQFLTEAVVTGDLDHPNIVPIHDVAITGDSTVFYSMKRVVGTPWSAVIADKSRDENIEILLKVADAIGFAHTRGVIHRDIKPDNVMLGDFGVVMVMDWGISLATPEFEKLDSITPATGLGGTPSMMSPEMATGPLESIGPAADIYLLGATLFSIITGKPPHHAANVSQCLRAVATNKIREFDAKHQGELMNIALKAMASRPEDRYATAVEFQAALRQYRSHSESNALTSRAEDDLKVAEENQDYAYYARATFGFEEAISLWPGNQPAQEGLRKTKLAHAEVAYASEDFDLGLSVLDRDNPEHHELITRLENAQQNREFSRKRLSLLRKVAASMLAFILIFGSLALYQISAERSEVVRQSKIAQAQATLAQENARKEEEQRNIAEENEEKALLSEAKAIASKKEAEESEQAAKRSEAVAIQNKLAADKSKQAAEESAQIASIAREAAEYESYVSQINLTKLRIDNNEFSDARRILTQLEDGRSTDNLPWELRYLRGLTRQAQVTLNSETPIERLSFSSKPQGKIAMEGGIGVTTDNSVVIIDQVDGIIDSVTRINAIERVVTCSTIGDNSKIAVGTNNGEVWFYNSIDDLRRGKSFNKLSVHDGPINDIHLSGRYLITASQDRTLRITDCQDPTQNEACWHDAPVQRCVFHRDGDQMLALTVVADQSAGRIVAWDIQSLVELKIEPAGVFNQHPAIVTSLDVSPNGRIAVSGDDDGNVFAWQTNALQPIDYQQRVEDALDLDASSPDPVAFQALATADRPDMPAHRGSIRALRFSPNGQQLLSAGNDYLTNVWKMPASKDAGQVGWIRSLRGNGGSVLDAAWLPVSAGGIDNRNAVVTSSEDNSIRQWETTETGGSTETILHDDEIWSADMSPDGRQILTAGRDRTAKVVSMDSMKTEFVSATEDNHSANTLSLPSESLASENRPSMLLEGSHFRAMSMRVSKDQELLLVGGADSVVRIWDIRQGIEIASIPGTGLNYALGMSDDASLIVTGSSAPDVRALVWKFDRKTKLVQRIHQLKLHEENVSAIAVSNDGKLVFTGDSAGRGVFWNSKSGTPIGPPLDDLLGTRINDAKLTTVNDGTRRLWVAADDAHVTCFEVETRKVVKRFDHIGFVTQLDVTAANTHMVSISELQKVDGTEFRATAWDLQSGESYTFADMTTKRRDRNIDGGRPGFVSATFGAIELSVETPDILLGLSPVGNKPNRIEMWSVGSRPSPRLPNNYQRSFALALPSSIPHLSAAASTGDQTLVTLHGDSAFRWNLESRTHQMSYRAHGAITKSAFSADGTIVATASRSLKLWDWRRGKTIGKLETPHEGTIRSIAFQPKNQSVGPGTNALVFATGGDDQFVRLWQFSTEKRTFTRTKEIGPDRTGGRVLAIEYLPSGSAVVTTSDRGVVAVHSISKDKSVTLLRDASVGAIRTCRVSDDGTRIACGGDDSLARTWKVNLPNEWVNPSVRHVMTTCQGHAESIQAISFAAQRLLTGSRDGTIRVWDLNADNPGAGNMIDTGKQETINSGRELLRLQAHPKGVTSVQYDVQTGNTLTTGRDGALRRWPLH